MEQWLPIPGYEGRYEVSNLGRVRSVDRIQAADARRRPWHRKGKPLKIFPDAKYWSVNLHGKGQRKFGVHALVLTAFVGPCPEGMEGCHYNGDTADNRLSNLRWGTPKDNAADRTRHGNNWNSRKTCCPKCGGQFTVTKWGRKCRPCANQYQRERNSLRKAG